MRVQDLYGVGNTDAGQAAAPQSGKTQQAEAVEKSQRSAAAAGAGAAETDRVHLSDLTDRLSRLLGVEEPDRAARLERLSAQVQSERYAVDALAVSQRLVQETLRGG